ncbi:thermonuclease family protein [Hydrogenophaga sp. PBL-H3]|uniref:thermonuclease family protein n=1 Tax=Hydrogenophaga sp. PBL-H3 TaxID=434010 RepID=UPI00131FF7EF|nr:thermonuclease family protein [Hydrogenophaga sp. PBL-H3]QHE77494.1 thermonuclease family protein [Hydrogenophaga sp. PBL-H3]QHE81918.1 thermonuclease family protein [Hydrogenophaga sp. PBL-H3]
MKGWSTGWCVLLMVMSASAQEAVPQDEAYSARVSRVFDGDTVWVKPLAGGKYRKLRLDGIDAPEICQAGGEASRDVLARRVLNQVVEVRVRAQDDYGRGVARLMHQGDDVAAWMVSNGQAWSYRWRRSLGPLEAEETAARERRLGLFGAVAPELPRDFRKRHGPCPLPPRG